MAREYHIEANNGSVLEVYVHQDDTLEIITIPSLEKIVTRQSRLSQIKDIIRFMRDTNTIMFEITKV